jgi:AraC-like DNA-binding protein
LNENDAAMHYFEMPPDVRLRPFVRCYWGLRGPAPRDVERVLPDGCTEVILHFGDTFLEHGADGPRAQPRELLVGPSGEAVCIEPGAFVDLVAIRFRPGGAAILLPGPLSDYRGRILGRADCDIDFGCDAIDALSTLSDADRVRALERVLLSSLDVTAIDAAVRQARRRIYETNGAIRIDMLATETGLTIRQLQRRFNELVGLPPKGLARVVRLQHAIGLARAGNTTLAGVAASAGYSDQAHFNRQFREIAGITPGEFFREQNRLDVLFSSE